MQPLRAISPRSALILGLVTLVAGSITGCGDYLRPKDSATNAHIAQTQVEHFVEFYNRDGLEVAVELNVCPDDQPPYLGRESLDEAPWVADSMAVTTPVGIDGDLGQGHIAVTVAGQPATTFKVNLRRDDVQGWCITGLVPS